MKADQLKILMKYRLDQSKETLNESEILYEQNSYRGAINRAYYAMFYSVLALLAMKKLGTSKHTGAISLFDKEFVKKGDFSKQLSKILHIAFDLRQTHDYGELVEIDKDTMKNILDDAKFFVKEVETYLKLKGFL